MMMLGETIRHAREAKGLTQRAAADVLGITDVHLCNIERNKARPSATLLNRIQNAWNVDIYLLAWCLHGDVSKLPKAVRAPMQELARAWKAELERNGVSAARRT